MSDADENRILMMEFLETDVWLWKLLWENKYGIRATILRPSFHDTEYGIKGEVESQIGGSIIKVISKTKLYERENDEILCIP